MREKEQPLEGWYYRVSGQTFGPVSSEQLREALAQGRLQSRQAVWRQGRHRLVFVHAATAAFDTSRPSSRSEVSKPA
jgi:hypothetical protein